MRFNLLSKLIIGDHVTGNLEKLQNLTSTFPPSQYIETTVAMVSFSFVKPRQDSRL